MSRFLLSAVAVMVDACFAFVRSVIAGPQPAEPVTAPVRLRLYVAGMQPCIDMTCETRRDPGRGGIIVSHDHYRRKLIATGLTAPADFRSSVDRFNVTKLAMSIAATCFDDPVLRHLHYDEHLDRIELHDQYGTVYQAGLYPRRGLPIGWDRDAAGWLRQPGEAPSIWKADRSVWPLWRSAPQPMLCREEVAAALDQYRGIRKVSVS
ncbi:MAG: hypothetical protein JWL83_58 [Actinomycetia bacterium]|nr:hypothetical protein [Actinomycetes bacterium]